MWSLRSRESQLISSFLPTARILWLENLASPLSSSVCKSSRAADSRRRSSCGFESDSSMSPSRGSPSDLSEWPTLLANQAPSDGREQMVVREQPDPDRRRNQAAPRGPRRSRSGSRPRTHVHLELEECFHSAWSVSYILVRSAPCLTLSFRRWEVPRGVHCSTQRAPPPPPDLDRE